MRFKWRRIFLQNYLSASSIVPSKFMRNSISVLISEARNLLLLLLLLLLETNIVLDR